MCPIFRNQFKVLQMIQKHRDNGSTTERNINITNEPLRAAWALLSNRWKRSPLGRGAAQSWLLWIPLPSEPHWKCGIPVLQEPFPWLCERESLPQSGEKARHNEQSNSQLLCNPSTLPSRTEAFWGIPDDSVLLTIKSPCPGRYPEQTLQGTFLLLVQVRGRPLHTTPITWKALNPIVACPRPRAQQNREFGTLLS